MKMPRFRDPERKLTKQTDCLNDNPKIKYTIDSLDMLKRWTSVGENGPNYVKPRLDSGQTGRKPKANDKNHKPYPSIKEETLWEQEYL